MVLKQFTNEFKEILTEFINMATMTNEIWKTIENYETYSVSNLARVRKDESGMFLKGSFNTNGYLVVKLRKDGKQKNHSVHRLIAQAFIPNLESKEMVDHHDNDTTNNSLENLRWASRNENIRNSKLSARNTSSVKGVCWSKRCQKWEARITVDGKRIHLGYFATLEEATTARRAKANELFGVFTNSCEKPSILAEILTA